MKTVHIYLLLLLFVAVGCNNRQTTQIADVTKPATLSLSPAPRQGVSVYGLSLHISGEIEGEAEIWGDELGTNRITGKFEVKRNGDYYATNCVIEYRPIDVRAGRILIQHEFRCLN